MGEALSMTDQDGVPSLDLNLFAPASLKNPFADYSRLRDAGPVVRLCHPDVYAIGRFADVQAALRASDRLISGEGVGFSDVFNAPKGLNVIQTDGDIHRRMRSTVARPLSPAMLKGARADLKALVAKRVAALTGVGEFDAMKDLAAFLPVEAVSHLVGLPEVGRDRMLEWAAAAFNVIGPDFDPADGAKMKEAFAFMATLSEETVRSGSWAGELFAAAKSGRLSPAEAMAAISAYVIPSLDTTILAKGHLLHNLARHPAQWALLNERPELIPGAVLEGVRHRSVLRWFSRVAAADYAVEGFTVPKGARVMLLYGCANHDERHYRDPDRFDVTRDARDHLAWGTGPHMCAGMHLARIEMEVLLEALVEAGVTLTGGEPTVGTNAGLYGFTQLPFRIERNG
jgi:cytochrome P450